MKKILITGANSYIGTSFEKYMEQFGSDYSVDTVDMIGDSWKSVCFSGYDCVFHVAGIAHQKETLENAHLYYEVNRNLAIATAKKAKREGVKQFILLSSMSVYGMETGVITKKTIPHPKSHYGKSKLQADERIVKLDCDSFKVAILRPPMVYGKGCKGNYQRLRSFAFKSPIFPDYPNKRSMIYIDNLCEFVKQTIDSENHGLFFPQNAEYVNTSEMVKAIAEANGKNICFTKCFNLFIRLIPFRIIDKVFGSLIYDKTETVCFFDFKSSLTISEK
ncbi:MAG: NAD-dependent epimerase/dehydratase family protein [Ruminococcus sp.]|nr:NAD-dependent epimerase/dehydratase family protein [Ruminococcus sp.]